MAAQSTARTTLTLAARTLRARLPTPTASAGASAHRALSSAAAFAAPSRSLTRAAARPRWSPASATAAWQLSAPSQRRTMFIQTESTPNADSLKFIPGQEVSPGATHEFLDAGAAAASPLADRLFHLPDVKSVFFGPDFISVNKTEDGQWSELKPEIYSIIMEHFTAGRPLFEEGRGGGAEDTRILDTDSEVVAMIKELLETRVRPAIMEDGGDIEYRGFDEDSGVVQLSLKGSCRGCESSAVTLKSGIERMLMHYIPEVKEVEQVLGPAEAVAEDEFAKFEERLRMGGKTVSV
ncbi:Nfu1p [Rhodotorula paludigena]|uniref:Nfu1p n=1 Tax=Rhodotorula paludigena TaxID=86838 RepID=UPI00316F1186